ncbi:hypothetical protein RFI_34957 [Reticulomyxa filosa]|uniref:Uncharacterized protein n=1 Tax=Reticulomyxa filosa TaxID=46433 RepID=X6LLJ2_RETFI|nr:hypothetical protein RFI_34957 [Reticulomyxa filosa]|eukprot:ETO02474.1 hypothetical protein RFI_34957 [Reticulomyxa filosa]
MWLSMKKRVTMSVSANTLNKHLSKISSHTELIKILSKLNVEYNEVYNGIVVEQALVAKANIHSVQNEAFYRRDASNNKNYFQLSTKFPKFITNIKQIGKKYIQFYFDKMCFIVSYLVNFFE